MAYRFKLDEGFEAGLRRIGLEQLAIAQTQLAEPPDPAIAVHEARKALKRARALLRLARPGLGDGVARRENDRLREAGRLLAGERDREVLIETVERMSSGTDKRRRSAWIALRAAVEAGPAEPTGGEATARAQRRAKAVELLAEAAVVFERLDFGPDQFSTIGGGLEAGYRSCRLAFETATTTPSDETLHDFRKSIQRHWRQMLLLSRAWPGAMRARAAAARELSQLLGEDHDLAMLCGRIEGGSIGGLSTKAAAAIVATCRGRQAGIRELARPAAERLLLERPRRFRRRIEGYWSAAVALAGSE